MKAPIQSRKHYVQQTITPVSVGVNLNINVAIAKDLQSVASPGDIREGAIVKAVFVEVWVIGQSDSASGNALLTIMKIPGGGTSLTAATHAALDGYDNKKNILYHTQGIINDGVANATPFIRQWFKIPKGKQRFGLDDRIVLSIMTQAESLNFCGFQTFKEYF